MNIHKELCNEIDRWKSAYETLFETNENHCEEINMPEPLEAERSFLNTVMASVERMMDINTVLITMLEDKIAAQDILIMELKSKIHNDNDWYCRYIGLGLDGINPEK